jgi:hypothetical protein
MEEMQETCEKEPVARPIGPSLLFGPVAGVTIDDTGFHEYPVNDE